MSTENLQKIKSQIEKAKTEQSEIQGKRSSTIETMKDKFGVDTIEAAEKELSKRGTELDKMENDFNSGYKELEESYDWGM